MKIEEIQAEIKAKEAFMEKNDFYKLEDIEKLATVQFPILVNNIYFSKDTKAMRYYITLFFESGSVQSFEITQSLFDSCCKYFVGV